MKYLILFTLSLMMSACVTNQSHSPTHAAEPVQEELLHGPWQQLIKGSTLTYDPFHGLQPNDIKTQQKLLQFAEKRLVDIINNKEKYSRIGGWEKYAKSSKASIKRYKPPYILTEFKLSNGMLIRTSTWDGYLKEYVATFPLNKRDDVLRGLTRFYTEYDKVDKIIKFEPLRYRSGPYTKSYVSLKGSIVNSKVTALLKFKYSASSWIFADKITIIADDFKWKSTKLKFYRDNYTNIWEYTHLDLSNPIHRNIANKIASSKEVIVRFHGNQYYGDIVVTKRMKQDIKEMLLTIDTISNHKP